MEILNRCCLLKDLLGQGGVDLLGQGGGREGQANMEETDRERLP